jgi:hypothetical protein
MGPRHEELGGDHWTHSDLAQQARRGEAHEGVELSFELGRLPFAGQARRAVARRAMTVAYSSVLCRAEPRR